MMEKKLYCGSKVLDLSVPAVMGILNLTPDSFYDGGRHSSQDTILRHVESLVAEGASIIDAGAVSTRPGAGEVPEEEELERLIPVIRLIAGRFPGIILSADTFRPGVALAALESGADMINDIYGGRFAQGMFETVAQFRVPYILMHMKGTPATMQSVAQYDDVVSEVTYFFENQVGRCREAGLTQVILDPGFGFGKTPAHNFTLLSRFATFKSLGCPLLAGISRKSMITRTLGVTPGEALNGTTVLNTIALMKGADILRVHDVREACDAVRLFSLVNQENSYLCDADNSPA
jgi:dihydropteroate synthase